jgi:hypothetical protein
MRVVLVIIGALALGLGASEGGAHQPSGGHHHGGQPGRYQHHYHFHGAYFVGTPFFYPWPYTYAFPPPYYFHYYPGFWLPYYRPPVVYVEQFVGNPAPGMRNIYCPNRAAYYPKVLSCPGGWMRVGG